MLQSAEIGQRVIYTGAVTYLAPYEKQGYTDWHRVGTNVTYLHSLNLRHTSRLGRHALTLHYCATFGVLKLVLFQIPLRSAAGGRLERPAEVTVLCTMWPSSLGRRCAYDCSSRPEWCDTSYGPYAPHRLGLPIAVSLKSADSRLPPILSR